MKNYGWHQVFKWVYLTHPRRFQHDPRTHGTPKPFPGQYPTRWLVDVDMDQRRWTYCGKPSRRIGIQLSETMRAGRGAHFIRFIEFDRIGPIVWLDGLIMPDFVERIRSHIWVQAYYYPTGGGSWTPGLWARGFRTGRIRIRGQLHPFYYPMDRQRRLDFLRGHRQFVELNWGRGAHA